MYKKEITKLANDSDPNIRFAIAKQGYYLDILKNDCYSNIRAIVASKGYALDELVNDPSPIVRCAVANQGYALNKLVNDPDDRVRLSAFLKLKQKQDYGSKSDKIKEMYKYYHEYKYHDPVDTTYNYEGYSEEYYNYN